MGDQSLKMPRFIEGGTILLVASRRLPSQQLLLALFIAVLILAVSLPNVLSGQDNSGSEIPANDLGTEVEGLQDPVAEEQLPKDPDEQFHQDVTGYFASEQSADWIRALTLLGSRIEAGDPPQWIGTLLLDLLTEQSQQNPERTRTILKDRLIRSDSNGIPILLVLLRQDANWPFRAEVESNLRVWSVTPSIRERLLTELSVGKDALLITRLLPILAARDPRRTVEVAIVRLASEPEGSSVALVAALSSFLGLDLSHLELVQWWEDNRDQPIISGILERQRQSAQARELKTWERANRLLREVAPNRYRSWLLDSLRDSEPGTVRSVAIIECGRFARELHKEGSGIEPDALRTLLTPVRDRLLEIITLLDDPDATLLLAERQELAVACFGSLSHMTSFREDQVLVALLKQQINSLIHGSANGERRIAREALKMATTLRAPVARAVDDALERFRPARGQDTDVGELRRLIAASRAIGCTSRTVDLLGSIAQEVPELQEAVLETLVFGEIPDDAVEKVLAYYGGLLQDSTDDNIRALTINGIGRLGVEEAIPLLTRLVLGDDGDSETERKAALTMIRSIGGPRSLVGFIEILMKLPDSDALYPTALADVIGMIPTDPSLGLVRRLLMEESGQRYPWYDQAIRSDGVVEALQAKGQPTDLRTRSPGRFEQWILLQSLRIEGMIADLLVLEQVPTEKWREILDEVTASIGLFGEEPLPSDLQISAWKIRGVATEIESRLAVEDALSQGDTERITEAFSGYLEGIALQEANPPIDRLLAEDPWDWLLKRIEKRPPLESDPALVRSLRTLAERVPARDDVRERLDLLEARADSGGKERSPSPPLPVPDEEAEGQD